MKPPASARGADRPPGEEEESPREEGASGGDVGSERSTREDGSRSAHPSIAAAAGEVAEAVAEAEASQEGEAKTAAERASRTEAPVTKPARGRHERSRMRAGE